MLRLLVLAFLVFSSHVLAQDTPASLPLMTIGPIDSESDQKASIITVRYDAKPGFATPKIEAMGSFVQVTLPNSIVPKAGQFIEAKSPYIRKFAVFQLDEQTAGIRLFVTKEASQLVGAFKADILENRVVIALDHAEAERLLLANFDGVPVSGGPTPEEVIQKTEVRKDIPDPVKLANTQKESPITNDAAPSAWTDGLQDKLVVATIFSAVMLALLLAMKTWRKLMVKKWPGVPAEDFSLKTLATHAVGPKQKLTVIQVGQEQILLGVSPDSINFLTSLKKTNESPRMAVDPQIFQKPASLPRSDSLPKRNIVLDEHSPRPAARPKPSARNDLPEPGSAISYGVGDDGIKNMKQQKATRVTDEPSSVDDVTRMIRKKLRDLPKV